MEKMNKNDFIDVYVLETINEIKNVVKGNIKLDKGKNEEKEIDKKMSMVLKDLINANFKNLQMDPKGNMIYTLLPIVDKQENEKVRLSLVLYYTALYYDNVDLLHDLLRGNVIFDRSWYVNLQYLDKSISSKFERSKYVEMIKTCGCMFRNFSRSIENLSKEEREKYIQRFEKLISLKYDLICDTLSDGTYYDIRKLEDIFVKEKLDTFTYETYIQANVKQLELINSCHGKNYSKETCDRLNNLMQTRCFVNQLCNFDLMMKLYTDDELETLDYNISYAIDKFSHTGESLNKIIDFINIRPDLALKVTGISENKFLETDNFTLIEVCDHFDYIYDRTDFTLVSKVVKPKVTLKKVLGAYKKKKI